MADLAWRPPLETPHQQFAPFALLPASVRDQLLNDSTIEHVAAGKVVFEEGGRPDALYVVLAGRLTLLHGSADGRARIVCHLGAKSLACCVTALDGRAYPATAVAATRATLCRISCVGFRRLLCAQPSFANAALTGLGTQLRQFACNGAPVGDAGARIAAQILSATAYFGPVVHLTRREIAQMAGTTVETAIRETRKFESSEWIALARGQIHVFMPDALRVRAGSAWTAPPDRGRRSAASAPAARAP